MKVEASNLFMGGIPRYIKVYKDEKIGGFDPWTVVFTRVRDWISPDKEIKKRWAGWDCWISLTENGYTAHGESDRTQGKPYYGKPKRWDDLNTAQRKSVLNEYAECWGVNLTMTAEGYAEPLGRRARRG